MSIVTSGVSLGFFCAVGLGLCACAGTQKPSGTARAEAGDQSRCDRAGKRVEELDLNGDGKPDVWKMYTTAVEGGTQLSVLTCKEIDCNFDGRKDMWVQYDTVGNKVHEEFDLDFDGKVDLWVIYQNGRKVREEMDTNFDGKPDLFKFYENDRLARIERSSKRNGKIDVWEYYEGGKLDRIGYDTTGSGKPDRWDRTPDNSIPAEDSAQAAARPAAATLPKVDNVANPDREGAPAKGADKAPDKKP